MQRNTTSPAFPWRFVGLLLLACVAIAVYVGARSPRPAPFVLLRQPVHMPVPLRDRFGRWIPATRNWAWAWRVEELVFGQRKPVNLYAEVVSLAGSPGGSLSGLPLGQASFSDTNGLQVWLLAAEQLKALREHLKQMPATETSFRPRISTADGIECRLFQGQSIALNGITNPVGCSLGCFARVHPSSTDLTACITISELVTNEPVAPAGSTPLLSIQTNLDTALRLQIPKGNGFFLLDRGARGSSQSTGIIIDPPQP